MRKFKLLLSSSVLIFSSLSIAATVTQVKDMKVLVTLDGERAASGSEFYVINAQGKKVAIIRIKQVKGGKAIAEITKGTARVGYTLMARAGAGGGSGSPAKSSEDSYYEKKLNQRAMTGNSYGIVGGYLMNSMTATFQGGPSYQPYTVNSSMSGSGFGALGFYNYVLSPAFTLKGMVGVEQYNVSGSITTSDCSLTTTCNVKLTYLSFYGYGIWNFYNANKFKLWAGLGGGYLYAASKSSTVLNQAELTANEIVVIAGGADIRVGAKSFVPLSLEYGIFPPSSTVKASIIYLRAGYGWYF